jgi:hypothetical protein
MNRLKLTTIAALLAASTANAQITKTSIAEHFTNTSCGSCAFSNPSILSNLAANPAVLHLTFHPSSPYSNDFFNTQNKNENDDRTNHYNIFGSTPKVVLNGTNVAVSSLNTALAATATQLSNYAITISQTAVGTDSFTVNASIKKVATDTNTTAKFFIGVVEDTVVKTTNNGETHHYNVFRKSVTNTLGNSISLPTAIGDSIIINLGYKVGSTWQYDRVQSIAILQNNNKQVINAAKSTTTTVVSIPTSLTSNTKNNNGILFYPNPSNNYIVIQQAQNQVYILNNKGQIVHKQNNIAANTNISVKHLANGVYFITNNLNNPASSVIFIKTE